MEDTSIKIPDLRIKFGNLIILFDGIKEIEESKLMSELWDLTLRIENYMSQSKFVKIDHNGHVLSIMHHI
jgi:hypothetical protein